MSQIELSEKEEKIKVKIPLTTTSGKIRIKARSIINEYGLPHASRSKNFSLNNYVEWQIGYDVLLDDNEKLALTTLVNKNFVAYNGKRKALYELSEYLFYFAKWGLVSSKNLEQLKEEIEKFDSGVLVENTPSCQIKRTHPKQIELNGILFNESKIEYPLLIHKFDNFEIITEIVVREKQRAVGTQAMLYLCFPITELAASHNLLGRKAELKETAYFVFDKNNYQIILQMVKIFGMLSQSHRKDIIAILDLIKSEI